MKELKQELITHIDTSEGNKNNLVRWINELTEEDTIKIIQNLQKVIEEFEMLGLPDLL